MIFLRRKRKISSVKILLVVFFVLLILAGIGMIFLHFLYSKKFKDEEKIGESDSLIATDDDMVLNVLLVGLDEIQEKQRGRSDSMMVVSLDARHKKVKLTSLMRDLWVPIPKHGYSKLNSAYAYGGIKLLVEVINSVLGLKIDRYIVVDFKKFEEVIDKFGGIDMDLTPEEVRFINSHSSKGYLTGSGKKHLNGDQALQYARDRDDPSADFKRTQRQRILISAIMEKFKSSNLVDLMSFAQNAIESVKTNFSPAEVLSLVRKSEKFMSYNTNNELSIPVNSKCETRNGQSVLTSDLKECRDAIGKFIYEEKYLNRKN